MDQPQAAPAPRLALTYDGRVGELYMIFLPNLLLTILTLGIYSFWAATRMRRYTWSRTAHDGRRFAYHGTGGELFVGWLLAIVAILALFAVVVGLAAVLPDGFAPVVILPFYAVLGVLGAGAVYAAQRYRLSRTTWAGVRGGMAGSPWRYGVRALLMFVALPFTLFQLLPWVQVRLAEQRINASYAGATPFRFAGRAGQVYLVFLGVTAGVALAWLLVTGLVLASSYAQISGMMNAPSSTYEVSDVVAVVSRVYGGMFLFIGAAAVMGLFYRARLARHIIGNTTLGPMRLASSVTAWGLLGLLVGNGLILLFTLGLGYPVAVQRNARYLARTLWAHGTLDPAALGQATGTAPRFGEGFYAALDGGGLAS